MGIDWFTFGAQIVNFLILVVLLKKFLYGPIINAMDERERKIAERIEEADRKKERAEKEEAAYQQELRQLEQQREEILAEARKTADERHDELMREAHRSVEQSKQEWYRGLRRQQESLLRQVRTETGGKAVEIARRALQQVANEDLQEEIVREFLQQLEKLPQEERESLAKAMAGANGQTLVRTAFDLSDDSRSRIRDALREKLGADSDVGFKTAEELICGVELKAGGSKVGWSLQDFLESLEFDFEHAIAEKPLDAGK